MPPIARARKLACLGAGWIALWLCACGAPPCASSAQCGEGLVCGLDGVCGPLSASGSRFAGSRWVAARDWAIASSADEPRADVLPIGGPSGAEALLSFAPLPAPSAIVRAVLVLDPHDSLARIEQRGVLVLEHVEPFRGGRLGARRTSTPAIFAAAQTALPVGSARPVRIDLTRLARTAAARRDRTLNVLVRLASGPPGGARFASPWSVGDRAQPRLELTLR